MPADTAEAKSPAADRVAIVDVPGRLHPVRTFYLEDLGSGCVFFFDFFQFFCFANVCFFGFLPIFVFLFYCFLVLQIFVFSFFLKIFKVLTCGCSLALLWSPSS